MRGRFSFLLTCASCMWLRSQTCFLSGGSEGYIGRHQHHGHHGYRNGDISGGDKVLGIVSTFYSFKENVMGVSVPGYRLKYTYLTLEMSKGGWLWVNFCQRKDSFYWRCGFPHRSHVPKLSKNQNFHRFTGVTQPARKHICWISHHGGILFSDALMPIQSILNVWGLSLPSCHST